MANVHVHATWLGVLVDCKERWPSQGAKLYLQVCRKLGLVPISYYLRHIDDEQLVLRHHSIDASSAKAIATPLSVCIDICCLYRGRIWMGGQRSLMMLCIQQLVNS